MNQRKRGGNANLSQNGHLLPCIFFIIISGPPPFIFPYIHSSFLILYIPGSVTLSILDGVLSISISKSLYTSPLSDFTFRLAFVSAGNVTLTSPFSGIDYDIFSLIADNFN